MYLWCNLNIFENQQRSEIRIRPSHKGQLRTAYNGIWIWVRAHYYPKWQFLFQFKALSLWSVFPHPSGGKWVIVMLMDWRSVSSVRVSHHQPSPAATWCQETEWTLVTIYNVCTQHSESRQAVLSESFGQFMRIQSDSHNKQLQYA